MTRDAAGNTRPIAAEELAELFLCLKHYRHILLGVSGGADSIALMVLAREWAKAHGRTAPKFSIATVDHGLRKDAHLEAELVAREARKLRLSHHVLDWQGPKPKSGIQERARAARYELLIAHAHDIGADALAVAHHADDQAETILMRLASGSGLAGLAGMKQVAMRDGFPIVRPLLNLPAARIRATLVARGIAFVDDPSNANPAFARVRLRQAGDVLAKEGLTRDRLQILARRMERADDALREIAAAAERRHRIPMIDGHLYGPTLFDEPAEVLLRVIQGAVSDTGRDGEAMLHRLENRILDLCAARKHAKALKLTIGGAILSLSADGRLTIRPESPRRKV